MVKPEHLKHTADAAAISVAATGWFKLVSWPDVAAFLSVVWLLIQIGGWAWKQYKKWRQ